MHIHYEIEITRFQMVQWLVYEGFPLFRSAGAQRQTFHLGSKIHAWGLPGKLKISTQGCSVVDLELIKVDNFSTLCSIKTVKFHFIKKNSLKTYRMSCRNIQTNTFTRQDYEGKIYVKNIWKIHVGSETS